jgi:large subunit ribosomal protein L31
MKSSIHPKFNNTATVSCACGNTFVVGSTQDSLITEICSNCHPFYTGKQRLLDTQGKVDTFKKKLQAAAVKKASVTEKKPRKTRTTTK